MTEREAFGAELKRVRERRGLTLDAIAEQTKVSASHFAGLERGDLSRWPSGIFRRAFVRSYAIAVGLNPEDSVVRFCRLFPDPSDERPTEAASAPGGEADPAPAHAEAEEPGSRLLLEQSAASRAAIVPLARRILAGVLDISIAVMPAALAALAAGVQWFWPVAAGVAMAGHLACYAAIGTTPGAWLMARLSPLPVVVSEVRVERRRADAEKSAGPRRHVSRHSGSRTAAHLHRVRH